MKTSVQQLSGLLARSLAPVYMVSGDEPYQRDQACRLIREQASQAGYTERQVFHVERGFDWQSLLQAGSALSLFAEKRLIELRIPTAKPGVDGAKAIQAYMDALPADTILLIVTGKLDASQQKAKWVKAIEHSGVFVPIWPIDPGRLPQWIGHALAQREMSATADAIALLVERVEGNLLAADQELEKLRLLFGPVHLEVAQVRDAVNQSARYDVFALVDAALEANASRVTRILYGLKAEGTEPILVLWALAREIRSLARMRQAIEAGTKVDTAMYQERVWEKRKTLIRKALSRFTLGEAQSWVVVCGQLDRVLKGVSTGRIWNDLLELALSMAGRPSLARHAR